MTFDEQLRRAFDILAVRLSDDIAGHANASIEELTAAAEVERAEAIARAVRDAWTSAEREAEARLAAGLAVVEARSRADVEREEAAARDRLLGAIRSMDRAQSLSEVLEVLVTSAGAEAARAGIFLSGEAELRSWRCTGFGAPIDGDGALAIAPGDAGIVADAVETKCVASVGGSSLSAAPAFAALPAGRRAVAVPLQMNDQVFAVLYHDQGASGESNRESWPAALEVLSRHAARSLEALTAYRLAQGEARNSRLRALAHGWV